MVCFKTNNHFIGFRFGLGLCVLFNIFYLQCGFCSNQQIIQSSKKIKQKITRFHSNGVWLQFNHNVYSKFYLFSNVKSKVKYLHWWPFPSIKVTWQFPSPTCSTFNKPFICLFYHSNDKFLKLLSHPIPTQHGKILKKKNM